MMSTLKKKILFVIIIITLSISFLVISGELLVGFVNPQPLTYPKWNYSPQYGNVLPENQKMDHCLPGKWHYVYSINYYGYHGPLIPISNKYYKKNIVILGDSYAFGTGVQDDEGFSTIMQNDLKDDYDVINLAVGGYGLTQEIRRYYEFGQMYQPSYVILQFCFNDPMDNFNTPVTDVKDGRFVFKDMNYSYNKIRSIIGSSPLFQKSHLYNLIRNFLYSDYFTKSHNAPEHHDKIAGNVKNVVQQIKAKDYKQENFYNLLLENFAKDLKAKHIKFIMISVNGELNESPKIMEKVSQLEQEGYLKYVEVEPWFANIKNFGSPEGHRWGKEAHHIIGNHLARIIKQWDTN